MGQRQAAAAGLPDPHGKEGDPAMGVGFIISVLFISALIGICARQALHTTEERRTPAAMPGATRAGGHAPGDKPSSQGTYLPVEASHPSPEDTPAQVM